jgi:hypothetical protein
MHNHPSLIVEAEDANGHVFGRFSDLCIWCGCDRPGIIFKGPGNHPCPKAKKEAPKKRGII